MREGREGEGRENEGGEKSLCRELFVLYLKPKKSFLEY